MATLAMVPIRTFQMVRPSDPGVSPSLPILALESPSIPGRLVRSKSRFLSKRFWETRTPSTASMTSMCNCLPCNARSPQPQTLPARLTAVAFRLRSNGTTRVHSEFLPTRALTSDPRSSAPIRFRLSRFLTIQRTRWPEMSILSASRPDPRRADLAKPTLAWEVSSLREAVARSPSSSIRPERVWRKMQSQSFPRRACNKTSMSGGEASRMPQAPGLQSERETGNSRLSTCGN